MATIDERVVEMKFDNAQFESGVKTSIGTLDHLKKALKVDNISASLKNLNSTANKIKFDELNNAAETVSNRFSILGEIGAAALWRLSNTAVTVGSNVIKALTINPIMDGFREYETQMNSIKTIHANLPNTTNDEINKQLDELNKYADQTIYSFGDMTRAIGYFTAAGVQLDPAVKAIKGLSNVAAGAGANNQALARAQYQVSQALQGGVVRLMDWNSLVQAGMANPELQEQLKATARAHGVAVDSIIAKKGSFRDSLSADWLTADIFIETMERAADATNEWGARLTDAATVVTTWSQLTGTIAEAVGTGWSDSMKIIIGDAEQSKKLFTDIYKILDPLISAYSDARNEVLKFWAANGGRESLLHGFYLAFQSILNVLAPIGEGFNKIFGGLGPILVNISKAFESFMQKIYDGTSGLRQVFEPIVNVAETTTAAIEETTQAAEDLTNIAKQVINSDFGNGQARITALQNAGYQFEAVQNKVNELLGCEKRYEVQSEATNAAINKTANNTEQTANAVQTLDSKTNELTKHQKNYLDTIKGFFSAMSLVKKVFGVIGEIAGRTIKVLTRIGIGFSKIALAITGLFGRIATGIDEAKETSDVFESIYNAIDGFFNMLEGPLKIFETVIEAIVDGIGGLDPIIAGVGKTIGSVVCFIKQIIDVIVEFINKTQILQTSFSIIGVGFNFIGKVISKIQSTLASFIKVAFNSITTLYSTLQKSGLGQFIIGFVSGIPNAMSNAAKAVQSGLKFIVDKLGSGFSAVRNAIDKSGIPNAFTNLWKNILEFNPTQILKNVLFIFTAMGNLIFKLLIPSIISRIKNIPSFVINTVIPVLTTIKNKVMEYAKKIFSDGVWTTINNIVESIKLQLGKAMTALKLPNFFDKSSVKMPSKADSIYGVMVQFASQGVTWLFDSLTKIFDSARQIIFPLIQGFVDMFKSVKFDGKSLMDILKMLGIVEIINVMHSLSKALRGWAGVEKGLKKMLTGIGKLGKIGSGVEFAGLGIAMLSLGRSVKYIAEAIAIISEIKPDRLWVSVAIVGGIVAVLAAIYFGIKYLNKIQSQLSQEIKGAKDSTVYSVLEAFLTGIKSSLAGISRGVEAAGIGLAILAIAGATFVIVQAVKQLAEAQVDLQRYAPALILVGAALGLVVGALWLVSKAGPGLAKVGGGILLAAAGMYIAAKAIEKWGKVVNDPNFASAATACAVSLVAMGVLAIALSRLGGGNGSGALKGAAAVGVISVAMYIVCLSIQKLEGVNPSRLTDVVNEVLKLMIVMAGIIVVLSRFSGSTDALKSAASIVVVAMALNVICKAVSTLADINAEALTRGLDGVKVMLVMMAGVIVVLNNTTENALESIANSVAIVLVAFSIQLVAEAISSLANLQPEALSKSLEALATMFVLLGIVLGAITALNSTVYPAIAAAAAIVIASVSMLIIAEALNRINPDGLDVKMEALKELFVILGIALGICAALGPTAILAGAAMVLVGAAFLEVAKALEIGANAFMTGSEAMAKIEEVLEKIQHLDESAIDKLKRVIEGIAGGLALCTGGAFGGADALKSASESIGEVSNHLHKWESVDESVATKIQHVLEALGKGLGSMNFDGWGAGALANAAAPIGLLGEKINSWQPVPESIGEKIGKILESISSGVKAFNWGGDGANAISACGAAIGNLGSKISEWQTVPDSVGTTIGSVLKAMSEGVRAMNGTEAGANAIRTSADSIGALGGQITTWQNVPDGIAAKIKDVLKSLGEGLNKMNGGQSGAEIAKNIGASLEPIPGQIAAWADLPKDAGWKIGYVLSNIADGLKYLNGRDGGVPVISAVAGPLSQLAPIIPTWDASDGSGSWKIGKTLSNIATGLGHLIGRDDGVGVLSSVVGPIEQLSNSIAPFDSMSNDLGSRLGNILANIATNVGYFNGRGEGAAAVAVVAAVMPMLASGISSLQGLDFGNVNNGLKGFFEAIANMSSGANLIILSVGLMMLSSSISSFAANTSSAVSSTMALDAAFISIGASAVAGIGVLNSTLASAGATVSATMSRIAVSISSAAPMIMASMMVISVSIISGCTTIANQMRVAGMTIGISLAVGLMSQIFSVANAARSLISAASSALSSGSASASSAGYYFAAGFARGISSGAYLSYSAAYSMARAAKEAVERATDINSPSRVMMTVGGYFSQGFGLGIERSGHAAVNSAYSVGKMAIDAVNAVLEQEDMLSPVITPVFDSSQLQNGIKDFISGSTLGYLGLSGSAIMQSGYHNQTSQTVTYKFDFSNSILNNDADMQRAALTLLETMRTKAAMYRG